MRFHNSGAELFVPDGLMEADALRRVTHLGIGAHQDDLEFMAFHGIAQCFESEAQWFGGVTCTDGRGSPRSGLFAGHTDNQMREVRREEQREAARLGRYGAMIQLDYPSRDVKASGKAALQEDLERILTVTRPEVVYTHNPADKHATHVAVVLAVIEAIRRLPAQARPKHVWGCEVWRDLDWLADTDKVVMNVSGREKLAADLTGVFRSQVAGGKRYDLAIAGRRRANATFHASHCADAATELIFGMDLTAAALDESVEVLALVSAAIDRFRGEVMSSLRTGGRLDERS